MIEEKVFLSKEEALKIANIKDGRIHCFLSTSICLTGADWSVESFREHLNKSEEIEVGGDTCRGMGHALVLWYNKEPYFFEHKEDELQKLLLNR